MRLLADRLAKGELLLGVLVKMPAPAIVELCAYSGADFVVLDTEHGVANSELVESHIRAADACGIDTLVRVGNLNSVEILRCLDSGATGIIVPHVMTADDATAITDAAYYPPIGRRSLATSTRAGKQGTKTIPQHIEESNARTIVIAQIEDPEAVANASQIAAVHKVAALFIGRIDLAVSMGFGGNTDDQAVLSTTQIVGQAAASSPDTQLCILANSSTDAISWYERGARVILFSASTLLHRGLTESLQTLGTYVSGRRVD